MLSLTIILTRLTLGLIALATVLPLFSVGFWLVRLCDFPRAQIAALTLIPVAGVIVWLWQAGWSREHAFLLGLAAVIVSWQLSHMVRYTPLWKKELPDASDVEKPMLRMAVANLQYENEHKTDVLHQLERLEVDLLLLIEVDEPWNEALVPLEAIYPYREGVVRGDGLGLVLLSRLPLEESEVKHLVSTKRASIFAKVILPNDQRVRFVGLHPTPPGLPLENDEDERHDSRIRDAELMLTAKIIADRQDDIWVVTGDFNDVAWSHTTRLFKRMSGLYDPRIGRGLYNSFHAEHPLYRFPIDQVFLSPSARIHELERFHPEGSDHFGIITSFSLEAVDPAKPHPEGDDMQEAEEMVDEGLKDAAEEDNAAVSPESR